MFDVYTERTIENMVKRRFETYIDLMGGAEIPAKNKITLMYLAIKDYEKEANQQIMQEAMDRKADQERRRNESK